MKRNISPFKIFCIALLSIIMMAHFSFSLEYVTKKSFQNIYIFAETKNNFLDSIPKNEKLPGEVVFRGIASHQWKIIDKLGDPLNCASEYLIFNK